MNVYFTGILSVFGLFLWAYKGYWKKKGEFISENASNNIAGITAILTALVSTGKCTLVNEGCFQPINGHESTFFNTVHLISAGVFLFSMGYMAIFKFTKSE